MASYWLYDSSFYIKTFERVEKKTRMVKASNRSKPEALTLHVWMVQDSALGRVELITAYKTYMFRSALIRFQR